MVPIGECADGFENKGDKNKWIPSNEILSYLVLIFYSLIAFCRKYIALPYSIADIVTLSCE